MAGLLEQVAHAHVWVCACVRACVHVHVHVPMNQSSEFQSWRWMVRWLHDLVYHFIDRSIIWCVKLIVFFDCNERKPEWKRKGQSLMSVNELEYWGPQKPVSQIKMYPIGHWETRINQWSYNKIVNSRSSYESVISVSTATFLWIVVWCSQYWYLRLKKRVDGGMISEWWMEIIWKEAVMV
jgi:hypothetical protein